jgi:5-hydroxyisourate hydrolase-like protein (transthyretin family)
MGTLTGEVINGTQGGSSVADLDVRLFTMSSGNATGHVTARTDSSGHFEFPNVAVDPSLTYVATVTFQDAEYVTEALQFAAGETTRALEITVYDSTSDDGDIRIVNAHTAFLVDEGALRVQEVFVLANMSDRTYIGSEDASSGSRKTIEFPLPQDFTDLELGGDLTAGGIVASDRGFADTVPVQPGGKEFFYTYRVSLASSDYTYTRRIDYPTSKYSLLVQGDRVTITSEQLSPQDPVAMGGVKLASAVASDLATGSVVEAEISGLSSGGKAGSPLIWIGAILVVGVAGAVAAVYLSRRKKPAPVSAREDDEENRLLAEIAQLDDDFEGGRIAEESYRAIRSEKKTELAEVMRGRGRLRARR